MKASVSNWSKYIAEIMLGHLKQLLVWDDSCADFTYKTEREATES